MKVTTIGLDIAKSVFQVHGVDETGEVVLTRRFTRRKLLAFFAMLPSCLIGTEACETAHHWARELAVLGHEVKLMPPACVKAYVKRSKTDAADAAAICDAVTRPSMRFVPVKSKERQSLLMLHRTRSLVVRRPFPASLSSQTLRVWLQSVISMRSDQDGSLRPGSGLFPNRTPAETRCGSLVYPNKATAVIRHVKRKDTPMTAWVRGMPENKPVRLVSVALANKTARIVWALMARGQTCHPYHFVLS